MVQVDCNFVMIIKAEIMGLFEPVSALCAGEQRTAEDHVAHEGGGSSPSRSHRQQQPLWACRPRPVWRGGGGGVAPAAPQRWPAQLVGAKPVPRDVDRTTDEPDGKQPVWRRDGVDDLVARRSARG